MLRAGLTAVLADEFLRVGVAHYIGTSWAVPDNMAKAFSTALYARVLPDGISPGESFGAAICEARRVLFSMRDNAPQQEVPEVFNAWAAYQHYGDPSDVIDTEERVMP